MKRVISILFLGIIIFQSFSSLYVLTSFYLNRTYISQNLCENRFKAMSRCKGKCYLAKALKQKEQQQQKFPDLKQKINLYLERSGLNPTDADRGLILASVLIPGNHEYSNTYLSSIFRPPKLA